MSNVVIAAFYKFVALEDYRDMREPLLDECAAAGIKGTVLLAREGINGTVAGCREGVDRVLARLRSDPRLADLEPKESHDDRVPFYRMKVRLKREIVTMAAPGADPGEAAGTHVAPRDWNALIADPEVMLIDIRNRYEVAIGSFAGAVDPRMDAFREFPAYVRAHCDPGKHRKVAMFCTGGVRCEKASSFMLGQGFAEVYQLRGGILKYLEEVPESESAWRGECFVFDNRVSVNHGLERGRYDQCHGCRRPIAERDKQSPLYRKGVCCPACCDRLTEDRKSRFAERQKQVELAAARRERHIGARPPGSLSDLG